MFFFFFFLCVCVCVFLLFFFLRFAVSIAPFLHYAVVSEITPTAPYPEIEALLSAMPTLDKNAPVFLQISTDMC